MKVTAQPLIVDSSAAAERRAPALCDGKITSPRGAELELCAPTAKSWLAIYAELFKARLTTLVLLTTVVGFYLGFHGPVDYLLMLHTLLATALVASGASALNQLLEREYDAKMRRTQDRPLPSGRLQPATVLWTGSVSAFVGL